MSKNVVFVNVFKLNNLEKRAISKELFWRWKSQNLISPRSDSFQSDLQLEVNVGKILYFVPFLGITVWWDFEVLDSGKIEKWDVSGIIHFIANGKGAGDIFFEVNGRLFVKKYSGGQSYSMNRTCFRWAIFKDSEYMSLRVALTLAEREKNLNSKVI